MTNQSFKISTWFIIAVATTIMVAIYAQFILRYHTQCFALQNGPPSPGLHFGYSNTEIIGFFSLLNSNQLTCYATFLKIWDSLFAMLYTAMHISWLLFIFKRGRWVILVPLLQMGLDWGENYFELAMMSEYITSGNITDMLVNQASMMTSSKWILVGITYLLIMIGIVIRIKNKFYTRK